MQRFGAQRRALALIRLAGRRSRSGGTPSDHNWAATRGEFEAMRLVENSYSGPVDRDQLASYVALDQV
jgi:hypothetical protein